MTFVTVEGVADSERERLHVDIVTEGIFHLTDVAPGLHTIGAEEVFALQRERKTFDGGRPGDTCRGGVHC